MMRLPIYPALLVAFSLVAQTAPKIDASHLTLQQAIEISLKNNLQVQISSEARDVIRAGVPINEGTFDWTLGSGLTLQHSRSTFDKSSVIGGPLMAGSSTSDARSWTVGLAKPVEWGGTFQLNYNPTYNTTEYNLAGTPSFNSGTPPLYRPSLCFLHPEPPAEFRTGRHGRQPDRGPLWLPGL